MAAQRMRDGGPVIWSPQPAQARFIWRYRERCCGGAAGGGRATLVIEALRQVEIHTTGDSSSERRFPSCGSSLTRPCGITSRFPKSPVQQQHTLLDLPQRGKDPVTA